MKVYLQRNYTNTINKKLLKENKMQLRVSSKKKNVKIIEKTK